MFKEYAKVKLVVDVTRVCAQIGICIGSVNQVISQDDLLIISSKWHIYLGRVENEQFRLISTFDFVSSSVRVSNHHGIKYAVSKVLHPFTHRREEAIHKRGIQRMEIIPKWHWLLVLYNGKFSILSYASQRRSSTSNLGQDPQSIKHVSKNRAETQDRGEIYEHKKLPPESSNSNTSFNEDFPSNATVSELAGCLSPRLQNRRLSNAFEEQSTMEYGLSVVKLDISISKTKLISHFSINRTNPSRIVVLEERTLMCQDDSATKSKVSNPAVAVKKLARVVINKSLSGSQLNSSRYIRILNINPAEAFIITKRRKSNEGNDSFILSLPGKISEILYVNDMILLTQLKEYFVIDAQTGNLLHESKPNESAQPLVATLLDSRDNHQNASLKNQYLDSKSPGFPYVAPFIASDPQLYEKAPHWGSRKPKYNDANILAMEYMFPMVLCLQKNCLDIYHIYTKTIVSSIPHHVLLSGQTIDGVTRGSMSVNKRSKSVLVSISCQAQSFVIKLQLVDFSEQRKIMVHPWLSQGSRKKHTIYLPEALNFLKDEHEACVMKLKNRATGALARLHKEYLERQGGLDNDRPRLATKVNLQSIVSQSNSFENYEIEHATLVKKMKLGYKALYVLEELEMKAEIEELYLLAAYSCLTNSMGFNAAVVAFERFLSSNCHVLVVLSLFKKSLLEHFPANIPGVDGKPLIATPFRIDYFDSDFLDLLSIHDDIFNGEGINSTGWKYAELLVKYLTLRRRALANKMKSCQQTRNILENILGAVDSLDSKDILLVNISRRLSLQILNTKRRISSYPEQLSLIDSALAVLFAIKECSSINISQSEFSNYNVDTFLKTSSSKCDEKLFEYCESILENPNRNKIGSSFQRRVVKKLQTSVVYVYARAFTQSSPREEKEFCRIALYKSLSHLMRSHAITSTTLRKSQGDGINLSQILGDVLKNIPLSRASKLSHLLLRWKLENCSYHVPRFLFKHNCTETSDFLHIMEDAFEFISAKYEFRVNSFQDEREEYIRLSNLLAYLRKPKVDGTCRSFLHHCDALDLIRGDLSLCRYRKKRKYRIRMKAYNHQFFMEVNYLEEILKMELSANRMLFYRGNPISCILAKHYINLLVAGIYKISERSKVNSISSSLKKLLLSKQFLSLVHDSQHRTKIYQLLSLVNAFVEMASFSKELTRILLHTKIMLHNILGEHNISMKIILEQKEKTLPELLNDAASYCFSLKTEKNSRFLSVLQIAQEIGLFEKFNNNGCDCVEAIVDFLTQYQNYIPLVEALEYIPNWIPLQKFQLLLENELDTCHHSLWTEEYFYEISSEKLLGAKLNELATLKSKKIIVDSKGNNVCLFCKQNILVSENESFAFMWIDERNSISLIHEKCLPSFEKESLNGLSLH